MSSESSIESSIDPNNRAEHLTSLEDVPADICGSDSVILCIKLPNCERIKHSFNCQHSLIRDVIYFAHNFLQKGVDDPISLKDTCLNDNGVPMKFFTDYSQTLCEAGLTRNTLLHFSYK